MSRYAFLLLRPSPFFGRNPGLAAWDSKPSPSAASRYRAAALVASIVVLVVVAYLAGLSHGEVRGLDFALSPARRHVYLATPAGLVEQKTAAAQLLKEDW